MSCSHRAEHLQRTRLRLAVAISYCTLLTALLAQLEKKKVGWTRSCRLSLDRASRSSFLTLTPLKCLQFLSEKFELSTSTPHSLASSKLSKFSSRASFSYERSRYGSRTQWHGREYRRFDLFDLRCNPMPISSTCARLCTAVFRMLSNQGSILLLYTVVVTSCLLPSYITTIGPLPTISTAPIGGAVKGSPG